MIQLSRLQSVLARRRARGVSLLTAVFLVVVLAGLAATLARLSVVQQTSAAMDMLGVQAYQAARSGLDWGIHRQLRIMPPAVGCFATPQSFQMPSGSSLASFTVTVRCSPKGDDGLGGTTNAVGDTTNRWTIVSVACNQPTGGLCPNLSASPDYVQRTVRAEL